MTQDLSVPPPAGGGSPPTPRRRGGILQVLTIIFLGLSRVGNAVLLLIVLGLAAGLAGGLPTDLVSSAAEDVFLERVVERGPASQKIAVIHIDGVIDEEMAMSLRSEIQRAADDPKAKAVILRINSPGGGLTASDMIHHDIRSLLTDRHKPVVAAMDGVAASGGYYVACAADEIVAQPTTVTGSIGVIAQFFFLSGLLKDKLGVATVTLKMGEQKDWPNLFAADMTEAQRQYMMDTLLKPGYDQFVDLVAECRKMDRDEVLRLATGRIFMAKEAKEKGLVDEVGYFDRAIERAMDRAGIHEARIVEYIRPFRLTDLLGLSTQAKTVLDLRPEKLAALGSPKVMYLWTGY